MASEARPTYTAPTDDHMHEGHVEAALDFLVAIERDPQPDSIDEYRAAMAPYQEQIAAAMATLRRFAEETTPMSLEQLQRDYYGFTNNPRYLTSPLTSAVVCSALNQAWHGVGPWRK